MHAQRTHLLQQSIEEKQRILEEARKAVVMPQCADDNDMASYYESAHTTITLMWHARNHLQNLTQSMAIIESRSHALCLDCGEEIASRRLAAVPGAMRCAACQEEWEAQLAHSPGREYAHVRGMAV